MSEGREPPEDELSEEELEQHDVEELPDREAMSVIRGDVTIPLDPDIAADVLLDHGADEPDEQGSDPEGSDPSIPDDDSERAG